MYMRVLSIYLLVFLVTSCSFHSGIVLNQNPSFPEKRVFKNSVTAYNKINYYFGIADQDKINFIAQAKHDLNHSFLLESGDVLENISQDIRYTWFLFWLRKEVFLSADIYHYPNLKEYFKVDSIKRVAYGYIPMQHFYIIQHDNKKIFNTIHDDFLDDEGKINLNEVINAENTGYRVIQVTGRRKTYNMVEIVDNATRRTSTLMSYNVFDTHKRLSATEYEKIENKRIQYRVKDNEIKEVTLLGMNIKKCLYKTDDGKYEIGYTERLIF